MRILRTINFYCLYVSQHYINVDKERWSTSSSVRCNVCNCHSNRCVLLNIVLRCKCPQTITETMSHCNAHACFLRIYIFTSFLFKKRKHVFPNWMKMYKLKIIRTNSSSNKKTLYYPQLKLNHYCKMYNFFCSRRRFVLQGEQRVTFVNCIFIFQILSWWSIKIMS